MRVLLLYPYPHHKRMMTNLSLLLHEAGIYNDVICVRNFSFTHNSDISYRFVLIVRIIQLATRIPRRFWKLGIPLLSPHLMRILFSLYDKVDIHAFNAENIIWAKKCKDWHIKYDITLWGSEVLRASDQNILNLEWGYKEANSIRGIEKMLNRLSNIFNRKFDNKMYRVYFGNTNYDLIDNISYEQAYSISTNLGIKIPRKLTITCGYNGIPQQQHDIMIEVLQKLPSHIKERINVVVPMTYELNEPYYHDIKEKLDQIGVTYTILKKFLNPEELATLRICSDIVINTQTTDAFCGALQDHLYCENVVLIADWLDYPEYDSNKVFYIKTSKEELYSNTLFAIEHFEELKRRTLSNKEILRSLTSWESVLPGWKKAMDA